MCFRNPQAIAMRLDDAVRILSRAIQSSVELLCMNGKEDTAKYNKYYTIVGTRFESIARLLSSYRTK
jgi:hypothetical protein